MTIQIRSTAADEGTDLLSSGTKIKLLMLPLATDEGFDDIVNNVAGIDVPALC